MPRVETTVEIDLDDLVDDLEDSDLIRELESRGYVVLESDIVDGFKYDLNRNDLRECLFQMERFIPELSGLVSALDKLTAK